MKTVSFWAPARRSPSLAQVPAPLVDTNANDTPIPAFTFTGIVPEDIKTGIAIGLGGAGIAALSSLLPYSLKPVGVVSGVLIAGFGAYKAYGSVFGDPKQEACEIPQQSSMALARIQGEFLAPVNKGKVDLSTVWSDFWKSNRTYAIKFRLVNNSDKDLIIPVQVKVSEFATFADEKISTANFCVPVPANGQKIVDGFMPLFGDQSFGISCVGNLIVKHPTPTGQDERILQTIQFSV